MIAKTRQTLGRRRFRMAMLFFVRGFTHQQIAQSMRISRPFVTKEINKIKRQFNELKVLFRPEATDEWSEQSAKELGLLPSLN